MGLHFNLIECSHFGFVFSFGGFHWVFPLLFLLILSLLHGFFRVRTFEGQLFMLRLLDVGVVQ